MPVGIVFIKGDSRYWDKIKDVLEKYSLLEVNAETKKDENKAINFFEDCGACVLTWFKCFGWADFTVIIWSFNVESIKKCIILLRDEFKHNIKDQNVAPITTTVIGITDTEEGFSKDLKEFCNLLKKFSNNEIEDDIIYKIFNISRLIDFLKNEQEKITKIIKLLEQRRDELLPEE